MKTLNEVYSSLSSRRRYEVWFLRLGLADGAGAWWFRYLLMNPGKTGCDQEGNGSPAQVWATWFPADGKPQSVIQGYRLDDLSISARGQSPFHLRIGSNGVEENSCRGALEFNGHKIAWDLHYASRFRTTLSDKGWIGFSRTPHSDAVFSGWITLDGRRFEGDPLGFGLQGHNCGYRHRSFWTWAHAYFPRSNGSASTLEALVYDLPFGLVFRKAVLWHDGERYELRNLRNVGVDPKTFAWKFIGSTKDGLKIEAEIDGTGSAVHRLPYLRTDCKGSFEVSNNSLCRARLQLKRIKGPTERLETSTGAVLEMVGEPPHSQD
jgi:hypothetical protein